MGKVVRRGEAVRLQAVEIVRNGGTFDDAAQKTGFGRDYVRQLCTNAGIYKKGKHSSSPLRQAQKKEFEKEIQRLYKKGLNDKEIAAQMGWSISWVRQTRVKMGLPRQGYKAAQKKKAHKQEISQMEFRFCKNCGTPFYPLSANQLFCSKACQKRSNHQVNDIKRKRLEKARKVDDIALDDVYKKYNGICYLCGGKCDYNAVRIVHGVPHALRDYPSREHIIPLSKGGLHTWDNVRLAHVGCNSRKGVRYG